MGLVLLLSGCSVQTVIETLHLRSLVNFFSAGPIAAHERDLMLITFGLLLFVLIPVVVLTLGFAWRYRASNTRSAYWPEWHNSGLLELFLWAGPVVIVVILGTLTWFSTHDLDPYQPIESKAEPIRVQAVALDWKWLFIYPDYDVAAVNEMAMPVNVPVSMQLTSATVMNALMIPRLGSQIFAMSGMRTRLHLMATHKGSYFGKNYQYSGTGFDHMTFQAVATSRQGFHDWLANAYNADRALDWQAYRRLALPSEDVPVAFYSSVEPHLFRRVIAQFNAGDGQEPSAGLTESAAR